MLLLLLGVVEINKYSHLGLHCEPFVNCTFSIIYRNKLIGEVEAVFYIIGDDIDGIDKLDSIQYL